MVAEEDDIDGGVFGPGGFNELATEVVGSDQL
jgi:hypothetical protein